MKILSQTTEQFIYTLQQVEKTRNVEPLVSMFAEAAELSSPILEQPICGRAAVRDFWRKYLSQFRRVRSEFTQVVESDREVILEWSADVILPSGKSLRHRGVTILELDQGSVQSFRTYYDTHALLLRGFNHDRCYRQAG